MMDRRGMTIVCVLVGALACAAGAAGADEADATIARILDGVSGDAERAAKLVAAAGQLTAEGELAVKILTRAVDYAARGVAKPGAYAAGIAALDQLAKKAPAQMDQWRLKRLDLSRRAYRAAPAETRQAVALDLMNVLDTDADADANAGKWSEAVAAFAEARRVAESVMMRRQYFRQKSRWAAHFMSAQRAIAAAGRSASGDNANAAARTSQRLLELLLIEMDDPEGAKKHIGSGTAEIWKTYVPMAALKVDDMVETASVELCDWYLKALAPKASAGGRELMLRRAEGYARRAVALHATKDVGRMEAMARLLAATDELAKCRPVGEMLARLRYVDLMQLVDLDLDAAAGAWVPVKGAIRSSDKPSGTLAFPVDADGSYRLSIAVARTKGAGDVLFTFPVADRQLTMTMRESSGWPDRPGGDRGSPGRRGPGGGPGRGDSRGGDRFPGRPDLGSLLRGAGRSTWLRLSLSGLSRRSDSTSESRAVNPNYNARTWAPYAVDVAVDVTGQTAKLTVALNRQKWLAWSGDVKDLPSRPDSPAARFSVQFTKPGLGISSARLRPVSGAIQHVRPGADSGASARITAIESGEGLPDWTVCKAK
jgi:hypothetical protein